LNNHFGLAAAFDTLELETDNEDSLFALDHKVRVYRLNAKVRYYLNDPRRSSSFYAWGGVGQATAQGKMERFDGSELGKKDSMFGAVAGAGYHFVINSKPSRSLIINLGGGIEPGAAVKFSSSLNSSKMTLAYGIGIEASFGLVF
jgi:hypothetical protein